LATIVSLNGIARLCAAANRRAWHRRLLEHADNLDSHRSATGDAIARDGYRDHVYRHRPVGVVMIGILSGQVGPPAAILIMASLGLCGLSLVWRSLIRVHPNRTAHGIMC
jgi:hypothetical protein